MTTNSGHFESSGKAVSTLPLWRRLGLITGLVIGLFYSARIVTQPVTLNAASAESAASASTTFYRNIEDIQPGDLVLSRDEHGTQIAPRPVRETYRRTSHHLRQLTFRDNAGREQTLQTTYEHPFWSVSDNAFVDAGKLQPGKTVTSPDGQIQTLVATRREDRPEGVQVFNFQVDGFHTYYVAGQSIPTSDVARGRTLLVHNSDCGFFDGTKYSDKVIEQMNRGPGEFHSFPDLVRNFEADGTVTTVVGGDGIARELLSIPGSYTSLSGRVVDGAFEFMKEADATINHRYFNPNLLNGD